MGTLHISAAEQRFAEGEPYLALTLFNGTDATVGPGGLRMLIARSYGPFAGLSISNHWKIGPGTEVFLTTFVPRNYLKYIDFVDYIGFDGTVHAIGDRLAIGWFGTELKRGVIDANVQA